MKRLHVATHAEVQVSISKDYAPVKLAGIVMGSKNKVSPKGRFAFLQLSDTSGAYEVAIFDETLLNMHRDKLKNGTLLLISADAKQDDNGTRIVVTGLKHLEEAAGNLKAEPVVFTLASQAAGDGKVLPAMKKLFGEPADKGSVVTLHVPCNADEYAIVTLGEKYILKTETLQQLVSLEGVKNVDSG